MAMNGDRLKRIAGLRKVEPAPASALGAYEDGDTVAAIFRVTEENYVPNGIHVRARVSPTMFTGAFKFGLLSVLERDKRVARLSLPRRQSIS